MSSPPSTPRGRPPLVPRPPAAAPLARPVRPTRPADPRRSAPVPDASRLPTPRRRRRLPAGARVADGRGLTATGAVVLLLLATVAGAAYDLTTGTALDLGFLVGFVGGCVLTALLVHREDLRAAVVVPPLVYAAVAFGAGLVDPPGGAGSFLTRQGVAVLNELVLDAPVLFGGTGAAALLAVLRWLGSRG